MTRTIQKFLVVVGIAGTALLGAGGCDESASGIIKAIEAGYTSVTGTSLFEDLGKGLAGSAGTEVEVSPPWEEPCCYGYGYWGVW